VEDDVILESVIVLGTIASDPKSAHLLMNPQTIPELAELIVSMYIFIYDHLSCNIYVY
jgi:hypothetical protein